MQKNTKEKDRQTFSGRVAREKREYEKQLRRAQRQCMVLGAVTIVLVGVQAWQMSHKENKTATETGGNQVRVVVPEEQKNTYMQNDTDSQIADKTDAGLLVLVNKEHELPTDYQVQLHWLNNGSCAVAEEMYDALKEMLTDGSTQGREFVVASGYRSREKQRELLDEDIMAAMQNEGFSWQEAYEQEIQETMPPGYSEHETGLAVDIVSLDYQILDEQQEYTEENQWLRENCSKYGFILRYPKGAEAITGVSYEAWHFRYVGEEAAEEIMERGITLEEYLEEQ